MRLIGDALMGDCLMGGADPPLCAVTYVDVACPVQIPEASGPAERLVGLEPCLEGVDC